MDFPASEKSEILRKFSREISELENDLEISGRALKSGASSWAYQAIQIGWILRKVRAELKHQNLWQEWIVNNCRKTSVRSAFVYRQMSEVYDASDEKQREQLLESGSIRAFLRESAEIQAKVEGEKKPEPKSWPPYLEALGRIGKVVGYMEKHPWSEWPEEGRAKAKEDVEGLVRPMGGRVIWE